MSINWNENDTLIFGNQDADSTRVNREDGELALASIDSCDQNSFDESYAMDRFEFDDENLEIVTKLSASQELISNIKAVKSELAHTKSDTLPAPKLRIVNPPLGNDRNIIIDGESTLYSEEYFN